MWRQLDKWRLTLHRLLNRLGESWLFWLAVALQGRPGHGGGQRPESGTAQCTLIRESQI